MCGLAVIGPSQHLRRLHTMQPKGKRHSAQPSVPCRDVNQGLRKGCTCAAFSTGVSGSVFGLVDEGAAGIDLRRISVSYVVAPQSVSPRGLQSF